MPFFTAEPSETSALLGNRAQESSRTHHERLNRQWEAAVAAGKEIKWVQNLLKELGYSKTGPAPLRIDNQSALAVAKNPEHHGRMKQLDLCYYWLRDEVASKRISVSHLATEDMPADLFTKALKKPQVEKLRKMMGLVGRDEELGEVFDQGVGNGEA